MHRSNENQTQRFKGHFRIGYTISSPRVIGWTILGRWIRFVILYFINQRIIANMIIYVKTLKGKTIILDVYPHGTIGSVKEMIEL